ncbi:hypothetical protein FNO01nite_25300 [Flavobacterium noncentrifugens]|uniref:4'-phosphopantetheinyl transferase superfamily protein n=1 Tax=Flavobacterium noncentrifugens TaxID=1128970 RepID=A0A1G8ZRN4_9FLAO|nr:4'-phosphopantetheinyl transferase superfamily protein [Flavobacterium noncentrifugens]GEP51858.1 hypothetical protein FNO01nite_25300 [Flavobacterium noncentrifugens]SDK17693.1 4'-phosphopantetheinyl transferase superfamily protein [Flavobacterium noncentrifugens]
MIGNDVVDLALAQKESNWKRNGFLQKIFTEKEHLQILNSENPEVKVWELWSRKEAAYKIWNRESNVRLFHPMKFECSDEDSDFGKVSFENQVYFTKTDFSDERISSIAVCQKSDFDAIIHLENRNGITKENGIPFLNKKPVSISNHGRFEQIISIL